MEQHALLESARALGRLAREVHSDTEHLRALAPPFLEALTDAGAFRLAVPRDAGGLETPPLAALDVFEELARHEPAAAWLVWNNTLPALVSRQLAPDVRRRLWADPRTFMGNSTRPTGRAVRERDGFRIDGRWSLVSGCERADHLLLRAVVGDGATFELIMAYLPKTACRIVDTWNAGGLRGTGSHDVVAEGVWAPAAECVSLQQPPQLTTPLYRMPFAALLSAGCASLCIGIASGALAALTELAATKRSTDVGTLLREQPSLLGKLARMDVQLVAARLVLRDAVGGAWSACVAGEPVSLESRARMWQAALHAAETARAIVRTSYELAGASALYESCWLERAHRDIHAATQHIIVQDFWYEEAGRVALGAAPLSPMFMS